LDLTDTVKQALANDVISEGHARALKGLENQKSQAAALQTVINLSLNVRQTEELVRKLKGKKPKKKVQPAPSPEVKEIEGRLRDALSTKVSIKHRKKGGSITIHYYSDEEFDNLIDKLTK
jgi:ParB family chromosome partitioning protein